MKIDKIWTSANSFMDKKKGNEILKDDGRQAKKGVRAFTRK